MLAGFVECTFTYCYLSYFDESIVKGNCDIYVETQCWKINIASFPTDQSNYSHYEYLDNFQHKNTSFLKWPPSFSFYQIN